ncbi:hypothetical protein G5B31_07815 [Rhodobacter sp. SGA-6-6]|uniref:hypothetical protein n=1 Tax=Rhodobacter sp. SGA-6-6 TaxID=2710882 RepID=UPI0013EDA0EF|nr:hypothetical protein [Rhodobacter sp. SGA-6-6]NGM45441.1 hypothetical protein [Rhodobacter sp. SGA-6-6]
MAERFFRWHIMVPLILLIIGLLPLFSALLTATVADVFNCRADEGGAYPCIVAGIDIGGLLSSGGMMAWLAVFSLPFVALTAFLWLMFAVIWTFVPPK